MAVSVRKRSKRAALLLVGGAVVLCATLTSEVVLAQSSDRDPEQSLTLDELEAYIASQREELEKVMANRNITESKAEALEKALEGRRARQREVEAEVQALCQEREMIEPGSLDACLKASEE